MLGFHEKRKLKHVLHSKPFLVMMLIPVGFVGFAAHNAYEAQVAATERRAELSDDLAALLVRTQALEEDIEALSDEHGIERALRQRYEVAREGEEVIVLIEEEGEEVELEIEHTATKPSAWQRFLELF